MLLIAGLIAWLSTTGPMIWIFGLLSVIAIPLVKSVLVALGLGFVVFAGLDLALDQLENYVFNNFNNLPTEVLSILLIAKFDAAFQMILSAYAAKFYVKATYKTTMVFRA